MADLTWIEVSELLRPGVARTGITRVVENLAIRYAERPDTRFFQCSAEQGALEPVDRSAVLSALAAPRGVTAPPPGSPTSPGPSRLARTVARGRRWLRRHRGASPGPGLHFGRGARVLVLGRGWDAGPLQAALAAEKVLTGPTIVQVLYDLVPVLLPDTVAAGFPARFASYLGEVLAVSDGLIAISARTRADALAFAADHGIAAPSIETVRLGDTVRVATPEPVAELAARPFMLVVGTFEPRKNYWLLYQALKLAAETGRELPLLVIVGRLGSAARAGAAYAALTQDPRLAGAVTVLHRASDGQLEWLYRECLFTVYPSLYEGWGLPVAEALSRGVPCIASSAGAISEIGGGLVDYCSPYDPAAVLGLIGRYLEPGFLDARRAAIRQGYRGRTWDEAFEDFTAAVDRLAGGDPSTVAGDPSPAAG